MAAAASTAATCAPVAAMVPPILLYWIEGSQFCAKVGVALDSRSLPFQVKLVSVVNAGGRNLPSGGILVPEMLYDNSTVVPDSSAILRHLDKALPEQLGGDAAFFPSPAVTTADAHVGSTVNACVLYWNWVSDAGYARSIRAKGISAAPALLRGPAGVAVDLLTRGKRRSMREGVAKTLGEPPRAGTPADDDAMRQRTVEELAIYEDHLASDGGGTSAAADAAAATGATAAPFLFGGTAPSAADCGLYAMVCRFVGVMGDAALPPALPDLWMTTGGDRLPRLRAWYDRMDAAYPIVFRR